MSTSNSNAPSSAFPPASSPYLYQYYPEEPQVVFPTAATAGSAIDEDVISTMDADASASVPGSEDNTYAMSGDGNNTISRILAELRSTDSLCRSITSECKALNTVLDGYRSILLDEMDAAFAALNQEDDAAANASILEAEAAELAAVKDKYGSEAVPLAERFTPRLMNMSTILCRLR